MERLDEGQKIRDRRVIILNYPLKLLSWGELKDLLSQYLIIGNFLILANVIIICITKRNSNKGNKQHPYDNEKDIALPIKKRTIKAGIIPYI